MFAKILEDQMRKDLSQSTLENDFSPLKKKPFAYEGAEYLHLASLLATTPPKVFSKGKDLVYQNQCPPKAPKPRPAHLLTTEQTAAYLLFKTYAPDLDPGFTQRELKRAWRKAALKAHPDRGGGALQFRQLKAAHEMLKVLVY